MMVRYTIRLKTGEARCCQLDGNAVVERLAQYEDSGLLPEEVERVKLALMGKGIYEIKEFDGLPIKRLRELAEADKDECVWKKVVSIFDKKYAEAKKLPFVRNPLAWALYYTWKEFDDGKRYD